MIFNLKYGVFLCSIRSHIIGYESNCKYHILSNWIFSQTGSWKPVVSEMSLFTFIKTAHSQLAYLHLNTLNIDINIVYIPLSYFFSTFFSSTNFLLLRKSGVFSWHFKTCKCFVSQTGRSGLSWNDYWLKYTAKREL